jgi:hypothetical protein
MEKLRKKNQTENEEIKISLNPKTKIQGKATLAD